MNKGITSYTIYSCIRSCFCYRYALIIFIIVLVSLANNAAAKTSDPNNPNDPNDTEGAYYDEISITLNVVRIGSVEISGIIKKQDAYLPVKEIFDFLKIKSTLSAEMDTISGYVINPEARFIISKDANTITYQGKTTKLKTYDLFVTGSDFYLKSEYFAMFGLDFTFNFRNLSVSLNTKIELPAIREMQQEQMRHNISALKGEKKADTTIGRNFTFFHMGVADWTINSTQQNGMAGNTNANLAMGMMVASGETNINLSYSSNQPFNTHNQYFRWRYVNNESPVVKQVVLGRIYTQTTASLYSPLNGVQISNAPTNYRKSFGTYRLSNTTQPGWTVELYVNDILVNYMKADASGFYTFDVPIVYGNSAIKLRFYGPWGEELTKEEFISIPFNFLPVNQFEYTFTGGVLNDAESSRFSKAHFGYGLTKRITVGGGLEYLSSLKPNENMPYINTSVRIGSGMLLSVDKSFGVRTKSVFNYRHPSNLQLELNYIKYDKEQVAIRTNYINEKRAQLSMPIKFKKFNAFTRLSFNQYSMFKLKYTSAEWLITGAVNGVSTNLTSGLLKSSSNNPELYSKLSFNFRLLKGIRLNPQTEYNYALKTISSIRCEAEKMVFKKGYINLIWDKNIRYNTNSVTLGMRYNFSFAQTSASARSSRTGMTFTQTARGSLLYDEQAKKVSASDQSQVGRAALVIAPFLDLNCNGIWDKDEPRAFGLNIKVRGGSVKRNLNDTTIQISGLEAYNNYFVEVDKMSFENIAWQVKKPVIKVVAEPNYFKEVQVPVSVVGEVAGNVFKADGNGSKGIGRIIVNIHNSEGQIVAKTLTEQDGYFSYVGLAPGNYTARLDNNQLKNLNMKTMGAKPFAISVKYDGDVVDGVELTLAAL